MYPWLEDRDYMRLLKVGYTPQAARVEPSPPGLCDRRWCVALDDGRGGRLGIVRRYTVAFENVYEMARELSPYRCAVHRQHSDWRPKPARKRPVGWPDHDLVRRNRRELLEVAS